jgi:hypothetical protein
MGDREREREIEKTNKDFHDARTTNIIANEEKTRSFLGSLHSLAIFIAADFLFNSTKYYKNVFFFLLK